MGTSISVDKRLSALEDILSLSPSVFSKVQDEFKHQRHAHHLKIWRFQEDPENEELIKNAPINLAEPQDFRGDECYLVLLLYRHETPSSSSGFPHSLWGMVESLSNLTPRGLESVFATDDATCLDTFLLSKRPSREEDLHYMLFIWNGKKAGALVKAVTLTKGFELDGHLVRGRLPMLQVLFAGGAIVAKQIQAAPLVTLESQYHSEPSGEKPHQPVYLLRWLWPEHPAPSPPTRPLFPKFKDYFLTGGREEPLFLAHSEELPPPKLQIAIKDVQMKPKMPSLALGGLQTREDQRAQYEGIGKEAIDNLDEDTDVRDTVRKHIKFEFYTEICSEVDSGLFIGSDVVARDMGKLRSHGITHVINCAANVCNNYFPDHFTYLHYFLKDARMETIECIFYETADFIDRAFANGGKVFVHCMQGVSRSVSVVLAYMIFRRGFRFEDAFSTVREVRGIASPNFGFQVQLMWWEKRLRADYESLPVTPRVFAVSSHQPETPSKLVVRLLMQNPYQARNSPPLDTRGLYVVQGPDRCYIWEGNEIGKNRDRYFQALQKHLELLQRHEKAAPPQHIRENQEPIEFWDLFDVEKPDLIACQNETMDFWYADLDRAIDQEPQSLKQEEALPEFVGQKATLFVHPDSTGLTIFDDDELAEESLLVLCTSSKIFVWQGDSFDESRREVERYVDTVANIYFGGSNDVPRTQERPRRETEEFLNYF